MAESVSPENVEAYVQGEISGQVAVGSYIVQIGSMYGGLVKVAAPEAQPIPRARPTPLRLLPRPFTNLLDREAEVNEATAALRACQPVEFYGQAGSGKTALLRYLAHQLETEPYPDGVVYLSVLQHPLADSLQCIFDSFYECDVPFKPSDAQLRSYLQDKHAILILDDVELTRDEVGELMNIASGCTFLLASSEQSLLGEGQAIALQGLPLDAALMLMEQELGRSFVLNERPLARELCTSLNGHPLQLLQMAAMVREDGRLLTEIASRVKSAIDAEALIVQTLEVRPEPERRLLAVLAALGGTSLSVQHLSAVTQIANPEVALGELQRRGVVQKEGQRYRLNSYLAGVLQRCWTLAHWMEQLLTYLETWAIAHQTSPGELLVEADAILQVLGWAVANGRWADVLPLVRVLDLALALGKRWEARGQVLQWGLQAAEALGDRTAQAWALNQLGLRALSLGDTATAQTALSRSLKLRESLDDEVGVALTRHNLEVVPPTPISATRQPGCLLGRAIAILALLVLLGGGIALGGWLLGSYQVDGLNTPTAIGVPTPLGTEQGPTPVVSPTGGPSPTYTRTPMPSVTETPTPTTINTTTPTVTSSPPPTVTSTQPSGPSPAAAITPPSLSSPPAGSSPATGATPSTGR